MMSTIKEGIVMKKYIFTLFIFLAASLSTTNAQQAVTSSENDKKITHIIGNHYEMIYTDDEGNVLQKGQYYKIGERFKPHGIWKLYDRNTFNLVTTAKYDKGDQLWVETIIDGQKIKIDKYQLRIRRLENRIATLEKQVKEKELE